MAMDKIEKDYLQEENMQSNDQGHSIANLAYKGIFAFCLDEVFYDSFAQTKKTHVNQAQVISYSRWV